MTPRLSIPSSLPRIVSEEAATVLRRDRQQTGVRPGVLQDPGELIHHSLLHGGETRQEPRVLEGGAEQVIAGVHQRRGVVVGHDDVVAAAEALVEEDAEGSGEGRILEGGGAKDGVDASVQLFAAVFQPNRAVGLCRVVRLLACLSQLSDQRVLLDLVPLACVLEYWDVIRWATLDEISKQTLGTKWFKAFIGMTVVYEE